MILEGFEIDHWSCIKHLALSDLPATGVIVLHGPNGTGKSSILEALRACLMDNKSTSKALGRAFPKNSTEKPRVSVMFRAAGRSWKITKQFNSRESKLESRTAAGAWKLETTDPSEAHDRTRQLAGGTTSALGLHQLLWLTQAEFQLPDPKNFDADVQSRLRAVLGVLQTPLDDRFLMRVKTQWCARFGARSKPGEKPKVKRDCPHDKALAALAQRKVELADLEAQYRELELRMAQQEELEIRLRDLGRQLVEREHLCALLQQEYERSLKRLEAHGRAEDRVAAALKELSEREALRERRADLERLAREALASAETARLEVEEATSRLCAADERRNDRRRALRSLNEARRELQSRHQDLSARRAWLARSEKLGTVRETLQRADQLTRLLDELNTQVRERPAPDPATIKALEVNRTDAGKLRAELEAAAIALSLVPEPGAAAPSLAIDAAPLLKVDPPADGSPIGRSVRRRAKVTLPGWGRVELTRGSDAGDLDETERNLAELDRLFAAGLAPFGSAAGDPAAFERLRDAAAEKRARDPELKRLKEEIHRLAPKGLDSSRLAVAELEKLQQAAELELALGSRSSDQLTDAAEIARLADQLAADIAANEHEVDAVQDEVDRLECEIEGQPELDSTTDRKSARSHKIRTVGPGLRRRETTAKERVAELGAGAKALRSQLDGMATSERIETSIREAIETLDLARHEFEAAKLSAGEESIGERLEAANEGLRAINDQISATDRTFHEAKGAMSQTEGLHQKRAAAAARVEALTLQTDREALEADAYDRLYALFEECREKQLGAVMGPIHDRILRWMQLLRIGGYQSIRFNDQFLPETLIGADGATELALDEESTGTVEQIALMVRLALGSALATPEEPVVAMLDDPLTHSDVVRLDRMRAVLRRASDGDSSSVPPAGPLQIVVFTCHPEWFALDGARTIDLSKPDVLSRRC